jgi:hypothetical protein
MHRERFLLPFPASIYPGNYETYLGVQAMNTTCIRFQCPSCRARIKAPLLLAGRNRSCPGCEQVLTVPRSMPEDAGPMLVAMEGMDYYKLVIRAAGSSPALAAPGGGFLASPAAW